MAIVYVSSLVTTRLTDVVTSIDSGGGSGVFRIMDALSNTLSSMQIGRPCASVSGNLLTFSGVPWVDPAPVLTGIPTTARIENSNGNIVISGLSVGTGSTSFDVSLSAGTISSGKTLSISPATITGH